MKKLNFRLNAGIQIGLLIVFCVTAGINYSPGQNLLGDPGFELSTPNGTFPNSGKWLPSYSGGSGGVCTTTSCRSGNNGLWTYTGTSSSANIAATYQEFACVANNMYNASAWMRSPTGYSWGSGSFGCVRLEFYTSSHGLITYFQSNTISAPNTGWTLVKLDSINAPINTAFIRFVIYVEKPAASNQAILNVDDCDLEEVELPPKANAGPDRYICKGDSVQLIGSGGNATHFLWSTGDTISTITVKPGSTTSYILKVTNLYSLSDYDTVTVFVNPLPNITFKTNSTSVCNGDSIIITASGGPYYSWNITAKDTFPTIRKKLFKTTNFKVKVTNSNGCIAYDSITINVNPMPVAGFIVNDSAQCLNENKFIFTNKSTIAGGNINFTWYFGDGVISHSKDISHSYSNIDTYSVKLVSVSNLGCHDSMTKKMTVNPKPVADFSIDDSVHCVGIPFVFTNKSKILFGSLNYKWNFGDGNTDTNKNISHAYTNHGYYTINLVALSGKSCSDTTQRTVHVIAIPDKPIISFIYGKSILCEGDSAVLKVNCYDKFYWQDMDTSHIRIIKDSGTYFVSSINSNSCRNYSDTVFITIYKTVKPTIDSLGNNKLGSNINGNKYIWFLNHSLLNKDTTQVITALKSGYYQVIVFNHFCPSDTSDKYFYNVTSSINEKDRDSEIQIYPNPVNNNNFVIKTNINKRYQIRILNMNGICLISKEVFTPSISINVNDLHSGVYQVLIITDNQVKRLPIIKL